MSLKIVLINQTSKLVQKQLHFRILLRIHAQASTLGPSEQGLPNPDDSDCATLSMRN